MSRLHLVSAVLLIVAFLPQKYEGCEHCYTTKEFAAHASVPGKPYNENFGIVATIDVYGHNIRHGQMSASSIMVVNLGDGSKETYNSIHVGWMVSPELYGDSYAHGDGYGRKGCYNMECPGFQLEQGSKVAPGAITAKAPTTGRSHHTITVKLFKALSKMRQKGQTAPPFLVKKNTVSTLKSERGQVKIGGCTTAWNNTLTAVGYYPGNLFSGLAEKASGIAFGGESRARRSLPTPPMGSGFLPSPSAASMANLQFVDQDGQSIPISSDLPVIADKPKCYYVSPIVGAKFFFGGPAGCF
ncbi:hypothetical protein GQ55_1G382000 [Panicum hallii var. hallii]|uniref:Neprosin PEP catalytic domain-containing protein n=1 Tax=Panicum hallii var. hallii TaxID=1504633 RepID=A0A2T7FBV3_9POAL|nr:hypothetical protein GQ55_1G382000 [Panicum hallii var. hallii]